MIRNVVVAHLKEGTPPEAVEAVARALRELKLPGLLRMTVGGDLGLRDGNAGFAVVSDLADRAAYQAYDADAEHNRIRRELVAPIVTSIERCQFEVN
ncbi:MAG TPA: Dabb family protein [Dehalococcoidia bacterium]|nr:Dabb family protein [Dehalococcoidia bacterium]